MALLCFAFAPPLFAATKMANQSARNIPIAYDVDVVVVGGSTAAVASAVAAAEQGAKVFLAAPRPYLGEDLCATYRLWLEPDEVPSDPLAKELFEVPTPLTGIPYTYEADQPSTGKHVDTQPPRILRDGQWGTAFTQSVEYRNDATISIDLGKRQEIGKIHVMFFQGPGNYEVESMTFQGSEDGENWKPLTVIENDQLGQGQFVQTAIHMSRDVSASVRYLKCFAKKTARAERMLIGEILIQGPAQSDAPVGLQVTTPMQVKRTLDKALLEAGCRSCTRAMRRNSCVTREGELAGIVMANRAGRQAVKAKTIIDATDRAWIARLAGADVRAVPGRFADIQADRSGRFRAERPRNQIAQNSPSQSDRRKVAHRLRHGQLGHEVQRAYDQTSSRDHRIHTHRSYEGRFLSLVRRGGADSPRPHIPPAAGRGIGGPVPDSTGPDEGPQESPRHVAWIGESRYRCLPSARCCPHVRTGSLRGCSA
jgi:hypothetical protein